jgi:RimJ/RimL family protein N-acetyltransferase
VADKETDELIGEIVVMPNDGTISLGYTFSYKHHRKGYAFEALSSLIDLLQSRYPGWDFISFTDRENAASRALLTKLGYKDMGYISKMDSQVYGKYTTAETDAEIAQAAEK